MVWFWHIVLFENVVHLTEERKYRGQFHRWADLMQVNFVLRENVFTTFCGPLFIFCTTWGAKGNKIIPSYFAFMTIVVAQWRQFFLFMIIVIVKPCGANGIKWQGSGHLWPQLYGAVAPIAIKFFQAFLHLWPLWYCYLLLTLLVGHLN